MAGITLEIAKQKLATWLEAEEALATSQSYSIGTRTLTRAQLADVREQIEYWNGWVKKLENENKCGGRNKVFRAVPRDL